MVQIKHKSTGKILLNATNDSIRGCTLSGHDLSGADFSNHDLSGCKFSGCNLCDCDFKAATMIHTQIENSVLKRANFYQANMRNADMSDNVLDLANLSCCTATETLFRHCKINGANLSKGKFDKADFFFCELKSDFTGASLMEANLFGADLTQADFTRADLRNANMTDARIARAIFAAAQMEGLYWH